MSDLITNVNCTVNDFESIKQAIIDKGVDVPLGTTTSQYSELINEIQGGGGSTENILPYSEGIIGYFDMSTFDVENKIWHNKIDKYPNFTFTNVSLEQDAVSIAANEYGVITTLPEPQTIYIIFKSKATNDAFNGIITKGIDFNSLNYTKDFYVYQKKIFSHSLGGIIDVSGADDFHLVTLANNQGIECKGYVDGVLYGTGSSIDWGLYQGSYYLNHMYRGSSIETYAGEYVKLVIFGLNYHTSEQVAQNSQYIMQKYFNN